MKVLVFGASGMVGQAVVQSCVRDARVERVLVVGRQALGLQQSKVDELVHCDFLDWTDVEPRFRGYDACFFCLGVSALGLDEAKYRAITYDITLSVALMLERVGTLRTFVYVSGAGTDVHSRQMWARVKGETENALLGLPFPQTFCFRPGYIQPMDAVRSKTGWYQAIYTMVGWMYPVLQTLAPKFVLTSDEVGRAMIGVAERGYPRAILESTEIREAAKL